MTTKTAKVELDPLTALYMEEKDLMSPESEVIQRDITELFWHSCKLKLQYGQLIVVGIRGEVRSGKSTAAIRIQQKINDIIAALNIHPELADDKRSFIFSDQTEFLRFINSGMMNVCVLIDEFNRMAMTGLGATTETVLWDYYSDVFAGKYIHRILCNPDAIVDKNTTLLLDLYGTNTQTKVTRFKLIYRDVITKRMLTLGHVDIDVTDLIHNWEKYVQPTFAKQEHTQQEQKTIDKYRDEDLYVRYQVKKYRRMALLDKHGLRDIREPEESIIVLDNVIELQEQATFEKIPLDDIKSTTDIVCRERKRIYSLYQKQDVIMKTQTILNTIRRIHSLRQKRRKEDKPSIQVLMDKTIQKLEYKLERLVGEQKQLKKLYDEFVQIS